MSIMEELKKKQIGDKVLILSKKPDSYCVTRKDSQFTHDCELFEQLEDAETFSQNLLIEEWEELLSKEVDENEKNFPAKGITVSKAGELSFHDSGQDATTFAQVQNEYVLFNVDHQANEPIEKEVLEEGISNDLKEDDNLRKFLGIE